MILGYLFFVAIIVGSIFLWFNRQKKVRENMEDFDLIVSGNNDDDIILVNYNGEQLIMPSHLADDFNAMSRREKRAFMRKTEGKKVKMTENEIKSKINEPA